MKIFGIDPGSERTGYGCVETDGSRHRMIVCGAISAPPRATFPEKLHVIHSRLAALLAECRPDSVAIENLFFATNVRSALKLGHARGVAMLAAVEAGVAVVEYTPAEIKRAVVGYGRAEKHAGAADGQAAARAGIRAVAARCRRRARGGHLPPARAGAGARGRPGRAPRVEVGDQLAPLPAVIAHLRGRILEKQPTRVIVEAGGVGYDVAVPLSTFYVLGEPGAEVALRIHTHVREDALALYGFATSLELDLFERLIGISGIGPKLALAVLSGIEPADLVGAIERADVARLTAIPGVGKKTSERIVLELKDRLPRAQAVEPGGRRRVRRVRRLRDDLLSALMNLGYHRPLAEKAVDASILTVGRDAGFERTLKQALREVAK